MARTILFLHGLDAGPQGRKARMLHEAGFRVIAKPMPSKRMHMLLDPVVIGGLAFVLVALYAAVALQGWMILLTVAGLAIPLWSVLKARLYRRLFQRCVAVQRTALMQHRVDAVVGSSFGGAVAVELLRTGLWTGPTLLLSPAQHKLARKAALDAPTFSTLSDAVASHVLVVHGTADTVIPKEHSQRLVSGSKATLFLVEDGHRLRNVAHAQQLADWVDMAIAGTSSE